MAFIKKIIILSEVTKGYGKSELRGLATVEKCGDKAVCRLTVFNLGAVKPGLFFFGIRSGNLRLQKFELTQTSQNFSMDRETDIDGVISCILVCKNSDKTVPLLWGSTDGKRIFEGNMTDGFWDAALKTEKSSYAEIKPPASGAPSEKREQIREIMRETAREVVPQTANTPVPVSRKEETAAAEYQDYAVAAENFYPADYGETADAIRSDTYFTDSNSALRTPHSALNGGSALRTPNFSEAKPPSAGLGKFYAAIKSQLDELFENYPKEEYLCQKLLGTDWVKVDYDNDGRYYTVGTIAEDGRVKYICYGVPGKYAKNPPTELKGFCQWMPFDTEQPEGEGYWMMYQDAESGKSVTLEII